MVAKKIVGHVTEEERNEIQTLFERRNGLNELAKMLGLPDPSTPNHSLLYRCAIKKTEEENS